MAGLGDLFGRGSIAEQFIVWGVMQQVLQPLLQPALVEIGKLVNAEFPEVPLTPEQWAGLVARGLAPAGDGEDGAKQSGVNTAEFARLVTAAAQSPALGTVIAALQRGLIERGDGDPATASLTGALADAGVRESWWPIIAQLAVQIPSTAEVMNAWLEGQITEGEARERYLQAGGDPTWFQTSYNANGQAPTPVQALELWNRGIIPESGTGPGAVSYEQAFLEGPWRNKWLPAFKALRHYLPPPRTVTAMFHDGQFTHDQAAHYLALQGLEPDLIAAYLAPTGSSTAATEKHLSKTDLVTLYTDQLLPRGDAETGLEALGYTAHDAGLILELADVRQAASQVSAGVTRVRSLFTAGKITTTEAQQALVQLRVDPAQARQIVETWSVTDTRAVKVPSAAQVVDAWYYQLISADDALSRLEALGYEPDDAYLLLAVKNKGPVPGIPNPLGPPPPPTTPAST